MDGDRASAARKLPQTAANFFVGPNSRVPRMTLAQSSHIIHTPTIKSPGLATSSQVARHKLRASPFPISPTATKDLSSPRSAGNPGSKVAEAVHLFSNLAEEAGASTSDRLETPATSSFYIETSPNSSPFIKYLPSPPKLEPSPTSNTSLTAGSAVDILRRDLIEQQRDGETLRKEISIPSPATIHLQAATGTECYLPPLNTSEEALAIPASALSDLTASPAISDKKKETLKPGKNSVRSNKASSQVGDQEALAQVDSRPSTPPPWELANTLIAQATSHLSPRASMSRVVTRLSKDFEDQESKLSSKAHQALLGELELFDSAPHIDDRYHHAVIEGFDNRHQTLIANKDLAGDTLESFKPLFDDLGETSRIRLNQDEGGDGMSHQAGRDLSLFSKETVKQVANQRIRTPSPLSRNRSSQHSQDDLQDSSDGDLSGANGATLIDLIEMVDTPASAKDAARPRDSRLDRTATWIKATMNDNGSTTELPASPHNGHVGLTRLSLVSDSDLTAEPAQLEHQRGTENLQQYIVEEKAASIDRIADSKDRFSTKEPAFLSDGDLDAAEIGAIDSRHDPDRSSLPNISPGQSRVQRLGRSFSQRVRTSQQAIEKVRRIPGRLKIPDARTGSSTRQRRGSLKLLELGRGRNLHENEQAASSQLGTSRSRRGVETGRKNVRTNVLRSCSSIKDQAATQAVSADHMKHHVGRMAEKWDNVDVLSDDEEVASVTTYKRLTLRRTSDFAVHTTPRRESRPLPGKLSRFGPEESTTQTPPRLERPLMRLRSSQCPRVVEKSPRPPGLLARPAESKLPPSFSSHGDYSTYRHGSVQQDTSDSRNKRTSGRFRSGLAFPYESEVRTDLSGLSRDAQIDKTRSPLRPSDGPLVDTGTQQEDMSVIKRKSPTRIPTSSHEEDHSFKPLKLQALRSAFSTPRRLAVSTAETSPRTVVSELWTPARSNPTGSALTDETRVSIPLGSRAAPLVEFHPGQQFWDGPRQDQRTIPTHRALLDSSRRRARSNSRDHNQASHDITSHLQSRSHSTPDDHRFLANTNRLGAHHGRRRSIEPSSRLKQSQRQQQRVAAASEHVSDTSVPGFEISFQLTEPQMAPDVQQGTLLEFGLRVHIKPSKSAPSDQAWTLRPSTQAYADSSIGSTRREASSNRLPQYEYDNLSASDMSRVQEEAQEHLYHTITSPRRPKFRPNAGGLAPQLSKRTEVGPDVSFQSTSVSDTIDSPNSRSYLRAMRLTGSGRLSNPRSVGSSDILDQDRTSVASRSTAARRPNASPGLASPLPYIKRAPPRAASVSNVVLNS